VAANGNALFLTESDLQAIRSQPAKVASFVSRCNAESGYTTAPEEYFGPAKHYSATGKVHDESAHDLSKAAEVAYQGGICYALTGDLKYARHTQDIVNAWATTVRGVSTPQGHSGFNFYMPQFIIAASLVRTAGEWDDSRFVTFLKNVVAPVSKSDLPSNQGDWGVLLDASIGAYTHDESLFLHAVERWESLMQSTVAANGTLPKEICRSDNSNYCGGPRKGINGISYTHWALLPATIAAKLFESQGKSVWQSPGGQKLEAAFDRAASWSLHPETFPFYESNGGKLNGVTNTAYFALLLQHYPNHPDAQAVLSAGNVTADRFALDTIF
jgi:hypothetical protein